MAWRRRGAEEDGAVLGLGRGDRGRSRGSRSLRGKLSRGSLVYLVYLHNCNAKRSECFSAETGLFAQGSLLQSVGQPARALPLHPPPHQGGPGRAAAKIR